MHMHAAECAPLLSRRHPPTAILPPPPPSPAVAPQVRLGHVLDMRAVREPADVHGAA